MIASTPTEPSEPREGDTSIPVWSTLHSGGKVPGRDVVDLDGLEVRIGREITPQQL